MHYICKEWLFVPGCKFIVNGITYEVDSSETEKTLHTSFGDYRPDIIVTTTSGKIFYFEIRVTNRKTELYAPKWDELGNDVVEVDTRYFINQKYNDSIPTFDLIYSEGKCYIKSYTRKDYDHLIGTRKVEWKRQSKLDYKIQWERLDWFWNALSEYKKDESKKDSVIESFGAMDISDRVWCYQNIKGKSCVDIKQELAENINLYYLLQIKQLSILYPEVSVDVQHISPLIYQINFSVDFVYGTYLLHDKATCKVKVKNKLFMPDMGFIKEEIADFYASYQHNKKVLFNLKEIEKLDYIQYIQPVSHYLADNKLISEVSFDVCFEDHIHNRYIKEDIGYINYPIAAITKRRLTKDYAKFREEALKALDAEFIDAVLSNSHELSDFIELHKAKNGMLGLRRSGNKVFYIRNSVDIEYCLLEIKNNTHIDEMACQVKNRYDMCLRKEHIIENIMDKYIGIINAAKNNMWHMMKTTNPYIYRIILDSSYDQILKIEKPYSKTSIEHQLSAVMNEMASGLYSDVRLLEVDNNIG